MSLLVALALLTPHPRPLSPGGERRAQAAATAADFFPLKPGARRVYEQKSKSGDATTLIDEVGDKPAFFDEKPALPIFQKSQFNQLLGTQYYRVDGPLVLLVGAAEERSVTAEAKDGTLDTTKPFTKKTVLMQLIPAMPVFKFDGTETTWTYAAVQQIRGAGDTNAIKGDETAIKGVAKHGGVRTVLGKPVEVLEVRADVQLGSGPLAQKIVETSVYGRGIGLVESVRKTSGGGTKPTEIRTRLVSIEDKKEGG